MADVLGPFFEAVAPPESRPLPNQLMTALYREYGPWPLLQKLTRWYELHMINKSVVAKNNEGISIRSLGKQDLSSTSPTALMCTLLRTPMASTTTTLTIAS